jgi:hypothetical protein
MATVRSKILEVGLDRKQYQKDRENFVPQHPRCEM